MDIITSTTDSIRTNRASHAVKLRLGGFLAAAVLSRFNLSRFNPNRRLAAGALGLSALAFPVPGYTYDAISAVKKHHSPEPYNYFLNSIWGAPATARARVQFPLVTGLQLAFLAKFLRFSPANNWLKVGALIVSSYPQIRDLWDVLSLPPGGADDGKWMKGREVSVAVSVGSAGH